VVGVAVAAALRFRLLLDGRSCGLLGCGDEDEDEGSEDDVDVDD